MVIVLSDLHLGDEGCSLNDENIIDEFINELKQSGKIDQIVLLGDIFDLSMGSFNEAIPIAKNFFSSLLNLDISEIILIPGNHDHHLWVLEVEFRDIITSIKEGGLPPKNPNYIREFKNPFISWIINDPIMREKLLLKYPNHKVDIAGRSYLFSHGHHLSTEGTLLYNIDEASSLNEFELGNSAIHELIQYSLEQDPNIQKRLEEAWENGGTPAAIFTVIDELLDSSKRWRIFGRLIRPLFSSKPMKGSKIDDKMIGRIKKYIKLSNETCDWFIFGHTHVPEGRVNRDLSIANSGSWLDEKFAASNSYILIDDKVTIRKFNGDVLWKE